MLFSRKKEKRKYIFFCTQILIVINYIYYINVFIFIVKFNGIHGNIVVISNIFKETLSI